MNLTLWLIAGAVFGWLATRLLGSRDQQHLGVNLAVGMAGALVGGWLLSPLLGVAALTPWSLSLPALLVSFFGAAILLAFADLFRSDKPR